MSGNHNSTELEEWERFKNTIAQVKFFKFNFFKLNQNI